MKHLILLSGLIIGSLGIPQVVQASTQCIDFEPFFAWSGTTPFDGCARYEWFDLEGSWIYALGEDGDLHIFDAQDPRDIRVVGKLPMDGRPRRISCLDELALVSVDSFLVSIDLSTPWHPIIRDTLIVGPFGAVIAAFQEGTPLVIGENQGITRLDVSDPDDLRIIDRWRPGESFSDLEVVGTDVLALRRGHLLVIDFSDPTQPAAVDSLETLDFNMVRADSLLLTSGGGSFLDIYELRPQGLPTLSASKPMSMGLYNLSVSGSILAINSHDGVVLFDLEGPDPVREIVRLGLDCYAGYGCLVQDGDRTYFAGTNGISILSLGNRQAAPCGEPVPVSFSKYSNLVGFGNHVLVAAGSDGLAVYDAGGPGMPTLVATGAVAGQAKDLAVQGNLVYVAGDECFAVFDLTDPSFPQRVGEIVGFSGHSECMALEGMTVWLGGYLESWDSGIIGIDVANPWDPRIIHELTTPDMIMGLAAAEGQLHAVGWGDEYGIYSTEGDSPILLSATQVLEGGGSVALKGSLAILGTIYGLRIFDVSYPAIPRELAFYHIGDGVGRMSFHGDYGLVSSGDGGLILLDVSDPIHPRSLGVIPESFYRHVQLPDGRVMGIGDPDFYHYGEIAGHTIMVTAPAPCVLVEGGQPDIPPHDAGLTAYPNPFNSRTVIGFTLPEAGPCRLDVHDARGRLVMCVFAGRRGEGPQEFHWDGMTGKGPAASGVYLARLTHQGGVSTIKIDLVR